MKLLIILAFLTIARGVELEEDAAILKELESLLQSDVSAPEVQEKSDAKEDDLGKLKALDELLSSESDESARLPVKEDSEQPSDDDDLMDEVISALERRGLRKPRRKQRKYLGDNECYDTMRSCQLGYFRRRCNHSWFKKTCPFSCKQCTTKSCLDSLYGCCIGSKVAADGPHQKGCEVKVCYNLKDDCTKADCKSPLGRKKCPAFCGLCRQPAPSQCLSTFGYGCCEINRENPAQGPKEGCPEWSYSPRKRPDQPTCNDRGFGCCWYDGSKAARGSKKGCMLCEDRHPHLCHAGRSWIKECRNPHSSFRTTLATTMRLCPKACGLCSRY